ncbi:MAG: hypothetical protein KatS3mg090_0213 [Patescibacteria group bacterium]|nr:MAG: hypothetical protein KatS3mg090_0213 [Patescibacteria group bacterium]
MIKNKPYVVLIYLFTLTLSIIAGASISYSIFARTDSKFSNPLGYKPPTEGVTDQKQPDEPKTESCPLNGELYTKQQRQEWEKRRPLGIMVENHVDARPQSGLQSADIVYEAVAEGGITRFLAIYYCDSVSPVGPVRSARVYFINILEGYGNYPLYAHVGGANIEGPTDALGLIVTLGWNLYNDLNQFSVPFPYFWRDYERLKDRAVEHTVYTSTDKLWQYAANKRKLTDVDSDGIRWDEDFQNWEFDNNITESGDVSKISFGFWNNQFANDFSVVWNFNPETNHYTRENGGKPHLDLNTNKPLSFRTIIVLFAQETRTGNEKHHLLYKLTGTGDGLLFYNGLAQEITWRKNKTTDNFKFYDTDGNLVKLPTGKIFVEILPTGNKVEY